MSRDDAETAAPAAGDETPAEAQARKFQRELSAGLTSLVLLAHLRGCANSPFQAGRPVPSVA
jgi:hypothetical protein